MARIRERLFSKLDSMRVVPGDRVPAVQRLDAPNATLRELTFYRVHPEQNRYFDGSLLCPGDPVSAVDGKLNETCHEVAGPTAVSMDPQTSTPYQLHFSDIFVQGQTAKGEATTMHCERMAVREVLIRAAGRESGAGSAQDLDMTEAAAKPTA